MNPRMNRAQALRHCFAKGEPVFGGHVFFTDPEITEAMAFHGFSFLWIDGEHCAFDLQELLRHIQACAAGGTASIVRVAWNDPVRAKPVLEMGPDGILFPYVCTGEEARAAVAACCYPPLGIRGFGPRRANQYGALSNDAYLDQVNDSFLRIVQIEHVNAVRNLRDIAAVEGIDLLMVGPNDLSASIGKLGRINSPESRALYDEIATVCKAVGKPFGVSLGGEDRQAIREWVDRGAVMIGCGYDLGYVSKGAQETLAFVETLKKP